MFLQLILTETISKAITLLTAFIVPLVKDKLVLKKKKWRPEFKQSEEIVWVLYFQLVIWFSLILCPYIALIQPVCIWIVFMSYYIALTKIFKKPVAQSNKEVSFN